MVEVMKTIRNLKNTKVLCVDVHSNEMFKYKGKEVDKELKKF